MPADSVLRTSFCALRFLALFADDNLMQVAKGVEFHLYARAGQAGIRLIEHRACRHAGQTAAAYISLDFDTNLVGHCLQSWIVWVNSRSD